MAKQFNPFHKWLGFDKDLSQPNHFQLFSVKSNSEDPIGFRKQIHARAKSMLSKLEQMTDEEVGERRKLHTKLRRYIVKAHETMLDDKLRAAYLKGLRQKVRDAKGSAKPLAVPPPTKGNGSQAASQTITHQPLPTMKGAGSPTIKQKSDVNLNKEPAVPMAIPLSKPEGHEVVDFEDNSNGEVNFDNLSSEEIVIKPGRVRRKKSWLIPVLCLLMTLLCVAGILALVMNFGNKLDVGSTNPKASNGAEPKVVANVEAPEKAPTADEIRKATEDLVNSKREESTELGSDIAPDVGSDLAAATPPKQSRPPITLGEPQLHSVRFLFERARKEMKRGRLDSALEQYRMADSIFDGKRPDGDQGVLFDELNNGRAVIKHLEGFWGQVKHSSMKITGGELEPEPGVFIGFVEGRENDVVLRFGENVAIPYRSLRSGLAMLLASKKGAPNLPAWRLQQAAFRILHSDGSDESKAKIEELIAAAEADEYDGKALRGFWNSSFADVVPDPNMTSITDAVKKEMAKELIAGKYVKVSDLDPKLAGELANGFTSASFNDPMMRIVALDESASLSQRSGDAFQMLDAVDELHNWTEVNVPKMKADGFRAMTAELPSAAETRVIGEAFYEYLMSGDASALDPNKLTQLKQRVLGRITGNGLDDLRRLISQTMD